MTITAGWTAAEIPDLAGRRAVVTGTTSGIGLASALELARHGAHVVMAARDPARGAAAVRRVRAAVPDASVEEAALDLADLASVRAMAASVAQAPIDLLVNNAGVMAVPPRRTADDFELQMGTNHLGHFALTGLLLPALLARPGARVVTVASLMHWSGALNFGDLMSERDYDPWTAYARSKLANVLFMRELDRRARAAGLDLVSVGAHPGLARTNLYAAGPQMSGRRLTELVLRVGSAIVGQSAAKGALPILRAGTDPAVTGGEYVGPRGPAEWRGRPSRARTSANARDDTAAELLWVESQRLTGVRFETLDRVADRGG